MNSTQDLPAFVSSQAEEDIRPSRFHKRLLQTHDGLFRYIEYCLYLIAAVFPLYLQLYLSGHPFDSGCRFLCAITAFSVLLVYPKLGIGRKSLVGLAGLSRLSRAWALVVAIIISVAVFTSILEALDPGILFGWLASSLAAQILVSGFCFRLRLFLVNRSSKRTASVIIGSGSAVEILASKMVNNIWLDEKIVGICDLSGKFNNPELLDSVNLIANLKEIEKKIENREINRVYITLSLAKTPEIAQYYQALQHKQIDVIWVPDIYELDLLNHCVREIGGLPLITLNETPHYSGFKSFVKGMFDRVLAGLLIIALSPVLLVIAAAVKYTSSGAIIFKQQRDGWDGSKFNVYKFRSMYEHKENGFVQQASRGDSRITPTGNFLRKTSLDELPQLFNVLFGSMSLVGPRPHAISHNQYYSDKIRQYMARGRVKPGMTGLAQIRGFRGETANIEEMEARVKSDLEYINSWTPLLDLKILVMTPFTLLSKNAF